MKLATSPQTQKIMRHNAAFKVALESLDVVVVEDSKQMQTIIRSMLGAMRVARVRTFDSAEKALQAMLTEPPHLIITDWRMEPVTGYQLLRSIRHRQMAPLCFVPVLMVTAHGTRPLVEKALRAGAHHVLVKPLAPSSLHQRLEWITRDERKFCLDPDSDFFVIDGVAAALAVQSERRQALDRARLHHARNGPAASIGKEKEAAAKAKLETEAPAEPAKGGRGMGDLVKPKGAPAGKSTVAGQVKSPQESVPPAGREAAGQKPAATSAPKPAPQPVRKALPKQDGRGISKATVDAVAKASGKPMGTERPQSPGKEPTRSGPSSAIERHRRRPSGL